MLPVLADEQDDVSRMKQMMRRSVMVSSFLVLPMMAGLAAVAEPLVRLLLTDKWLPCVPFLQICCIDFAFYPIHTANLQAINAMGRSDVFLQLELIKKSYGLLILAATVFLFDSVYAIAWGAVASTLLAAVVNASPNRKLLGYGYLGTDARCAAGAGAFGGDVRGGVDAGAGCLFRRFRCWFCRCWRARRSTAGSRCCCGWRACAISWTCCAGWRPGGAGRRRHENGAA